MDSKLTRNEAIERCKELGDPTPGDGWRRLLHRCSELLIMQRDGYAPVTPIEHVEKAAERLLSELQFDRPPNRTWGRGAQNAIDHFNDTISFYRKQKGQYEHVMDLFHEHGIEPNNEFKERLKSILQ
jgi:hypothetical protein